MSEKPTYVPKSYARARQTKFGEVLCLDFQAEALITFIRENTNERGYIKIDVVPRKTPDEKSTHSLVLNTWKPEGKREQPKAKPEGYSGQKPEMDDDVPF